MSTTDPTDLQEKELQPIPTEREHPKPTERLVKVNTRNQPNALWKSPETERHPKNLKENTKNHQNRLLTYPRSNGRRIVVTQCFLYFARKARQEALNRPINLS